MVQQKPGELLAAVLGDFQSHGGTVSAGSEFTLENACQIVHLFLVDVQVAVAGYAKLVATGDRQLRKQLVDELLDDR